MVRGRVPDVEVDVDADADEDGFGDGDGGWRLAAGDWGWGNSKTEKMKWEQSEMEYNVDFGWFLEVRGSAKFAIWELALRVLNYTSFCNK